MAQDFLNMAVLGDNLTAANKRGFRSIRVEEPVNANYDFRYFETFPSAWAQAYAFRKALEKGDRIAIEEWAVLLMLHFFGVLHLRQYEAAAISQNFDEDLWVALEKTYPKSGKNDDSLSDLWLLRADDTVVGAYYKPIVFFPNRGREAWLKS